MDVHSHALGDLDARRLARGARSSREGLTTIVGNPDGGGPIDLKAQAATLENGGIGVNAALVIGHATVRNRVLGQNQQREPTSDELDAMRALVSGSSGRRRRVRVVERTVLHARPLREDGGSDRARARGRRRLHNHIRDEGNYDYGVIASVDE
jgi:hypothetical protein